LPPLFAAAALLAASPAAAGMFDVAYSGVGGPSVNIQIDFDDTTDVISSVAANPNASPSSTLAGDYALLKTNSFAGNDNLVLPANSPSNGGGAPMLSRAGVSFTVTDGLVSNQTVYSVNLSEIPLPGGTYVFEISSQTIVSNGSSSGLGTPVFAQQSLSAPGVAPGVGLANLAAIVLAGLIFRRRLAGR
jgi:hypothetical protein